MQEEKAARRRKKKAAIAGYVLYSKSPDAMASIIAFRVRASRFRLLAPNLLNVSDAFNRCWGKGQDKNDKGDPSDDLSFFIQLDIRINYRRVLIAEKDHYNGP